MALGVDRYLSFSGGVRCCCHKLALAVNDAVRNCKFVTTVLQRINCIRAYLNKHTKRAPSWCNYSRDRIVTLDKEFATRWQSKLNVLEKYMVLRPYLARVLPVDAPAVLDAPVDDAVAECINVLWEVRRVARALEADLRVSAALAPRLLHELYSASWLRAEMSAQWFSHR